MAQGSLMRSGGGIIPSHMLETVEAYALENITAGDAVEYCMYPGIDVFDYSNLGGSPNVYCATQDLKTIICKGSAQNFIDVWKLIDGTYTKTQIIDVTPILSGAYTNRSAISKDGEYLYIVAGQANTSMIIRIYKYNGTIYDYIGSHGTGLGVTGAFKISPDGEYLLSVSNPSYGGLCAFKINNDGSLTTLVTSGQFTVTTTGFDVDSNNSADIVALRRVETSQYLDIYTRSSGVYTRLYTHANDFHTYAVAVSPTGKYIAANISSPVYLVIYVVDGTNVTYFTLPTGTRPTSNVTSLAFSPDGKYLYCGLITSPYILIYKIDSVTNTFTKLANPANLPTGNYTKIICSSDSRQILMSHETLYGFMSYITGAWSNMLRLRSLHDARYLTLNKYNKYKLGVANNDASIGQMCSATMFKVLSDAMS